MSGEITVTVDMPFRGGIKYTATFHRKKPASGIEYLLLKMIDFGCSMEDPDVTLEQMMELYCLDPDLLPFVSRNLERLANGGVIDKPKDAIVSRTAKGKKPRKVRKAARISPETRIRDLKITSEGREMLARSKWDMENLLLYSVSKAGVETTVGQLMASCGVHEDLFEMVRDCFADLSKRRQLRVPKDVTHNTQMSEFEMTAGGRETVEKMSDSDNLDLDPESRTPKISVEKVPVSKFIYYRPCRQVKYSIDAPVECVDGHGPANFGRKEMDAAAEYIANNPASFDLGSDGVVLNSNFDIKESYTRLYKETVILNFNEAEGRFEFATSELQARDRAVLDLGYFSGYSSARLLAQVPEIFEARSAPFEIDAWTGAPDVKCRYMLPYDFHMENGILFYGGNVSKVAGNVYGTRMDGSAGCDAMLITSRDKGVKYWFTRRPASIEGLEGKQTYPMIACYDMSREEISDAVDTIVSGKAFNVITDRRVIHRTAFALHDPGMYIGMAMEFLDQSKPDSLATVLGYLTEFDDRQWYEQTCMALEERLCDWISGGLDLDKTQRYVASCARKGLKLPGDKLVDAMLNSYDFADIADWLLKDSTYHDVLLNHRKYPGRIVACILNGANMDWSTAEMKTVGRAAEALQVLRNITGIKDTQNYSFDCSSVGDHKQFVSAVKTFGSNMDDITAAVPNAYNERAYLGILRYKSIFESIAAFYGDAGVLWRRPDLVAESNSFRFCASMEANLSDRLRAILGVNAPLDDLVDVLCKKRLLSKDESKDAVLKKHLRDFVKTSRICCTTDVLMKIDPARREQWVDMLQEIKKLKLE